MNATDPNLVDLWIAHFTRKQQQRNDAERRNEARLAAEKWQI